ncbi:FliG C-terminal domain-containing protein [Pontibacterium granulatum]|uniref:FliG C-terminal domain-containing protein n=1 Tax=Pontibacterium granulatum TaxID=2036029 RepID=UPI00249CBE64|nr:FliG C-terminal domain-containing protein [Pontibacterium granulatum]MDI3324678.1 FliG C-terminal domain-containing protein [Pontibacterium granulatum]
MTTPSTKPGWQRLALMLAGMTPRAAERMIEQIRGDDPALADWLMAQRISFQQILKLPQVQLALLIGQLTDRDLLLAMRGLSHGDKQTVLSGISKRRAQILLDELKNMAPVPKREVEDAQARIVTAARELESEGRLTFSDEPMIS